MKSAPGLAIRLALIVALGLIWIWPAIATTLEASHAVASFQTILNHRGLSRISELCDGLPGSLAVLQAQGGASGTFLDPASSAIATESNGLSRPVRLGVETLTLVIATEALAVPAGIFLAWLLFRTNVPGRRLALLILALAVFVPLPLHATAWLGAFGNAGRLQALGSRPILVGRFGAAVIHAIASLPWVVLVVGLALRSVEPELEEAAKLDRKPMWIILHISLRRALGGISAGLLIVALLTAGDMTVTDLLQIRTYAEEAYLQSILGEGPASAASVALPPLLVLGLLVFFGARGLTRTEPTRIASALVESPRQNLGSWRAFSGVVLFFVVAGFVLLPVYGLIWRAGRVGGRATLGRPPVWSLAGLVGTLREAADDSWEPLLTSLVWSSVSATLVMLLALLLAWLCCRDSRFWRVMTLATVVIGLAIPGPVAGMSIKLAYLNWPIVHDTPAIVVIGLIFRILPFAILIIWPVIRTISPEYFEAAALAGYGPFGQFFRVGIPFSQRSAWAAWAVAFALAIGELPATNLLLPPSLTTISMRVWTLLHTGVESHLAGVTLVMLGVVGVAALIAVAALRSLGSINRERKALLPDHSI